eukprot:6483976-Amphidinium_carterae.2
MSRKDEPMTLAPRLRCKDVRCTSFPICCANAIHPAFPMLFPAAKSFKSTTLLWHDKKRARPRSNHLVSASSKVPDIKRNTVHESPHACSGDVIAAKLQNEAAKAWGMSRTLDESNT